MSGELQPLPSPGVAIFPDFIAKQPTSLIMKREYISHTYNITTMDGQLVFRIDSEIFSRSHRKKVLDASSGQMLCTIRKVSWTIGWKYYAETQEDGPHLFDFESHSLLSLTGLKNQMSFANAAEDGKPTQIDYKKKLFGKGGTAHINGIPVAVIEGKYFKARTEYHLHIAAGLDMFLVVALAIALDDKARTQASASAGGGGGGS